MWPAVGIEISMSRATLGSSPIEANSPVPSANPPTASDSSAIAVPNGKVSAAAGEIGLDMNCALPQPGRATAAGNRPAVPSSPQVCLLIGELAGDAGSDSISGYLAELG